MFVCSPSQALVRRSDLHQRCSQAIGSSIRIAPALTMPTDSHQKVPDPGLPPVAGDPIPFLLYPSDAAHDLTPCIPGVLLLLIDN